MTITPAPTTSPLHLAGELDPHLSRWLWIVKMFLAVPHFIVLAVLGAAFLVSTLAAGVSILFTGRYPRALFEFNSGVLRWNWRVGFYVWAVLGTDKYPPFTLARTSDSARVDVDYPERLSRGLVLVKWLLAVPHLIIVGLVLADILIYPWSASAAGASVQPAGGYSILNLLVVIAGVFLLITGTYPRSLFSFVMGINRWLFRVLIYVALMTDVYPPFRLDEGDGQGGSDPSAIGVG